MAIWSNTEGASNDVTGNGPLSMWPIGVKAVIEHEGTGPDTFSRARAC